MVLKKLKQIGKVALKTAVVKPTLVLPPKMEGKNSLIQSILAALKAHPNVKIRNAETFEKKVSILWARTAKNTDCSTRPLARPFARSLAPITCSLALHYSLCSRAPLRLLALLLTLLTLELVGQ